MRTTVTIDDELLRQAKQRAISAGLTLSEYLTRMLREALREPRPRERAPYRVSTFGDPGRSVAHEPADFAAALERSDVEAFG